MRRANSCERRLFRICLACLPFHGYKWVASQDCFEHNSSIFSSYTAFFLPKCGTIPSAQCTPVKLNYWKAILTASLGDNLIHEGISKAIDVSNGFINARHYSGEACLVVLLVLEFLESLFCRSSSLSSC
jgi:hypothetical protein